MALPTEIQGLLLDVGRLLAFDPSIPVDILVLYDKGGEELDRIDHFWNLGRPRQFGRAKNADQEILTLAEDGIELDDTMEEVKSFRYLVGDNLSDIYETAVANRPEAGKPRVWKLTVIKPKFRSQYMGE